MQQVLSRHFSPLRRRLVMALPLLGAGAWSAGSWAGALAQPVPYQRTSHALMGTQVDLAVDGQRQRACGFSRAAIIASIPESAW